MLLKTLVFEAAPRNGHSLEKLLIAFCVVSPSSLIHRFWLRAPACPSVK